MSHNHVCIKQNQNISLYNSHLIKYLEREYGLTQPPALILSDTNIKTYFYIEKRGDKFVILDADDKNAKQHMTRSGAAPNYANCEDFNNIVAQFSTDYDIDIYGTNINKILSDPFDNIHLYIGAVCIYNDGHVAVYFQGIKYLYDSILKKPDDIIQKIIDADILANRNSIKNVFNSINELREAEQLRDEYISKYNNAFNKSEKPVNHIDLNKYIIKMKLSRDSHDEKQIINTYNNNLNWNDIKKMTEEADDYKSKYITTHLMLSGDAISHYDKTQINKIISNLNNVCEYLISDDLIDEYTTLTKDESEKLFIKLSSLITKRVYDMKDQNKHDIIAGIVSEIPQVNDAQKQVLNDIVKILIDDVYKKHTTIEVTFKFYMKDDIYDNNYQIIREDWRTSKMDVKRIRYCLSPAVAVGTNKVIYEKANVILY